MPEMSFSRRRPGFEARVVVLIDCGSTSKTLTSARVQTFDLESPVEYLVDRCAFLFRVEMADRIWRVAGS